MWVRTVKGENADRKKSVYDLDLFLGDFENMRVLTISCFREID